MAPVTGSIPESSSGAGPESSLNDFRAVRSMAFLPGMALGLYAAYYFALNYYPGLIRMDDFGYLQGVVDTLVQGRLQTHAWLEPYTATLSGLSAGAYRLSRNFPLSTWGLQSVFVLVNAGLLYRIMRFRLDAVSAALLVFALVTLPSYAHKTSEFGGTVTTVTALLLALWAYFRGHWAWFLCAAFLAFANRQNSIALLVLPAFHFLFRPTGSDEPAVLIGFGKANRLGLVLGLMVFGAAALFLHRHMNHTVAQAYGIYAGMDAGMVSAVLHTQIFGILAGLALFSGFGLLTGESPRINFVANIRKPLAPLIFTLALWLLPILWSMPMVSFLTPLIGSLDRDFLLQKGLLVVIPFLLWTMDFSQLKLDGPFCLFAGYICVSGLHGYWYDFYLMDVALAAWFFRTTRNASFRMPRMAKIMLLALIAGNMAWGYGYKIFSDKQMLSVRVYEDLERSGQVGVENMTDGTFGFLGWKLFDQYRRYERITYLANFLCYGRRDRVVVESELPWRRGYRTEPVNGVVINSGVAPIGFFTLRYRVVDRQGKAEIPFCLSEPLSLDRKTYRTKPYPLNSREWSEWIERSRREVTGAYAP